MSDTIHLGKAVPVVGDVDVIVVGAGIAGATAAVAAAREGARTMVIDRLGYPGGNMGPGMIGGAPSLELPPTMQRGMPGIPGEFVRRCERWGSSPFMAHYFRDAQVISYTWTQMMQEAGVEFLFNVYAGDPLMDGNRVSGLFVETKSGTHAIRAKVVVDATGDADVAARSGAPTDRGTGYFHPGIYFAMANTDVDRYANDVFAHKPSNEDIQWAIAIDARLERRIPYIGPLLPWYRKAWEAGEFRFLRDIEGVGKILCDHSIFRSVAGVQFVADPLRIGTYGIVGALAGVWRDQDPTSGDSTVMTALETACRTFIFETAQFLIKRVPGFEKAYLHMIAPYFGARGGRSIVSEHPVTREDIESRRRFDDVVFQSIDATIRPGKADNPVEYSEPYDFPYRQFLPRGVEGLLVTGRACIIQPPDLRTRWKVFLMGQAAGVAAALAATAGTRGVDHRRLQKILHEKYQMPFGDQARLRELGVTA